MGSVTLLVASTGRYLSGARLSFFIVADLALAVPRRFFASTTDISHLRMKLLSGVLLLLLGQALACPFRVEIISNEHGKTQVNVITEESTDGVKNQTEANQPMASGESSKKYVPNEEQHQYLGLQLNARQRVKLAEMIERDSRDYINEETMDVILRSIEAVSRMGSLTLGTSRPFTSTTEEKEEIVIVEKLPEPTVIETPATEAPSHTTTYPTFVDVHTTTTTESTNDYVWPPAVTTQSTGNKEQTKIIAWWNKMWYGKPAIGVN